MTRPTLLAAAILGIAWAACLAVPAAAGPELAVGIGAATSSSDVPDAMGFSAWGATTWTLAPRLRFGPMLFVDDQGGGAARLLDPNDGSDLGATAGDHRTRFGGGWRVDVPFAMGTRWEAVVGGTWMYYRIHDDRLGAVNRAISATGASLGLGMSRAMWGGVRLGGSLRMHRLVDDRQDHYVTATVDWMWRPAPDSSARRATGTTPTEGN